MAIADLDGLSEIYTWHVRAGVNTGNLCSVVLYECHFVHGAEGVVRRPRKPPHWSMLWSTDVLMWWPCCEAPPLEHHALIRPIVINGERFQLVVACPLGGTEASVM